MIFTILVSFLRDNVLFASKLFEIFSNGGCRKGTRSVEKISNNVDFSLGGNLATTWEYFWTFSSETKIMKIRHSGAGGGLCYETPPASFIWRDTFLIIHVIHSDLQMEK